MELLEKEILKKGKVLPGNVLKVGGFVNQLMDVKLISLMAEEIYKHYIEKGVNKILTVEASGIALAFAAAERFGCDMVFAKKSKTSNVEGELYSSNCRSYTHGTDNLISVPKEYISKTDKVLIIDDFLAHGNAAQALIDIAGQAGAALIGVASAIEKGFQGGGDKMRKEGVDVFSLAVIDSLEGGQVIFRKG